MKDIQITTVVVDDDVRALNRMKILLKNFPEIDILEQINDAEVGLKYIIKNEPDLVLLDVEMPGKTGLEVAEEINKNNLHTKIIFITSFDHYAISAIKTQAFDYLLKPVGMHELKTSLERYKSTLHSNLNKREHEIIGFVAKGLNSKAIAKELFLSSHTVDTYRRKILKKTGCKNAAELIMYAAKNNLI